MRPSTPGLPTTRSETLEAVRVEHHHLAEDCSGKIDGEDVSFRRVAQAPRPAHVDNHEVGLVAHDCLVGKYISAAFIVWCCWQKALTLLLDIYIEFLMGRKGCNELQVPVLVVTRAARLVGVLPGET